MVQQSFAFANMNLSLPVIYMYIAPKLTRNSI